MLRERPMWWMWQLWMPWREKRCHPLWSLLWQGIVTEILCQRLSCYCMYKDYTITNMLVVWFPICDNTACERDKDGRLCGGCGICRCGKCDCEPCKLGDPNIIGDPGDTCECSLKKCRAPNDPRICSGNGVCDCDTCDCNDRYTGNSSFANNICTAV